MVKTRILEALALVPAAFALCACNAVLSIPDRTLDPNLTCSDSGCVCDGGYASCDGDDNNGCETNLGENPSSCGACGHDCLGGDCVDGQCRPVALLSENDVADIVVVDGSLYITSYATSAIRRMPAWGMKDGIEVVPGTTPGGMLRYDKGVLYWATATQLLSISIDGGTAPSVLVEGVVPTDDMAVGGGYVYFVNYDAPSMIYVLSRVPVLGGTVELVQEIVPTDEPWSVIADDTRVYWSIQDGIVTTPHAAMTPTLLGQVFGLPYRMILDGTDIYWYGDGIYTMPIAGAAQRKLGPTTFGGSLTADATDIYFAADTGAVAKVSKSGGEPVELATGQSFSLGFPTHPVVDEKAIYWVSLDGLYRLAK